MSATSRYQIASSGTIDELIQLVALHAPTGDARVQWFNEPNSVGVNLLQMAALRNDNVDMIQYILQNGADPNVRDQFYGNSPLHEAAAREDDEAIEVLLLYGANIHARNKQGLRPIDLASSDKSKILLSKALAKKLGITSDKKKIEPNEMEKLKLEEEAARKKLEAAIIIQKQHEAAALKRHHDELVKKLHKYEAHELEAMKKEIADMISEVDTKTSALEENDVLSTRLAFCEKERVALEGRINKLSEQIASGVDKSEVFKEELNNKEKEIRLLRLEKEHMQTQHKKSKEELKAKIRELDKKITSLRKGPELGSTIRQVEYKEALEREQQLKSHITRLENELQHMFEIIKKEQTEYQQSITELMKENGKLQLELQREKESQHVAVAEDEKDAAIIDLKIKLEQTRGELAFLQDVMNKKIPTNDVLTYTGALQLYNTETIRVRMLSQELEQERQKSKNNEAIVHSLQMTQEELEQCMKQNLDLSRRLEQTVLSSKDIEQLKSELQRMTKQLGIEREQHSASVTECRSLKESSSKEIQKLGNDIAALQKLSNTKDEQITQLQERLEALQKQTQTVQKQYEGLQNSTAKEKQALEGDNTLLRQSVDVKNKQIELLRSDLGKLQKEYQETYEQKELVKRTNSELQEQLQKSRKQLSEAEVQHKQMTFAISKLESELKKSEEIVNVLTSNTGDKTNSKIRASQLNKVINEQQETIKILKSELTVTKKNLDEARQNARQLKKQTMEQEKLIVSISAELENETAKNETYMKESADIGMNLADCISELDEMHHSKKKNTFSPEKADEIKSKFNSVFKEKFVHVKKISRAASASSDGKEKITERLDWRIHKHFWFYFLEAIGDVCDTLEPDDIDGIKKYLHPIINLIQDNKDLKTEAIERFASRLHEEIEEYITTNDFDVYEKLIELVSEVADFSIAIKTTQPMYKYVYRTEDMKQNAIIDSNEQEEVDAQGDGVRTNIIFASVYPALYTADNNQLLSKEGVKLRYNKKGWVVSSDVTNY